MEHLMENGRISDYSQTVTSLAFNTNAFYSEMLKPSEADLNT